MNVNHCQGQPGKRQQFKMSSPRHRLPGEHVYDGMVLPEVMAAKSLDIIKKIVFDDSDVIISTHPKAGTTVMQEIAYLIQTEDFKTADEVHIDVRSPYMDFTDPFNGTTVADVMKTLKPPRLWKSHLPAHFFEETFKKSKAKFIIVFRNPKDVLTSMFFFYKSNVLLGNYKGSWDEYFQMFLDDQLVYGNYFDNVMSWWAVRDNPNVTIVNYEDIVGDPTKVIRQVAAHLGKTLSDDLVDKIASRTKFDNMKKKPTSSNSDAPIYRNDIAPFMRKGKVGDWQNHFSEEQSKIVDEMYKKRCVEKGLIMQF